jgi:hypothetical protein
VREGGIVLLDDIHWNRDLEDGWRGLAGSAFNAYSVDLGRLGMCIRGADDRAPQVFDFSQFTMFWRRGAPDSDG